MSPPSGVFAYQILSFNSITLLPVGYLLAFSCNAAGCITCTSHSSNYWLPNKLPLVSAQLIILFRIAYFIVLWNIIEYNL